MTEANYKSVTLRNGRSMPTVGLGCWQSKSGEAKNAVEAALDCGYRHIDTAYNYLNETEVGQGILNWLNKNPKNKREDIFVVSKLPGIGMSPEGVRKFLKLSLDDLKLSYLDLYLIHVPVGLKGNKNDKDVFPMGEDGLLVLDNSTDLIAIWKEMEKMVDDGCIRSIGVSNFDIRQMKKIEAISRIPCVNLQVELNVNFQQKDMANYCKSNDIVMTAYAPLGSPGKPGQDQKKCPLWNPVVKLVADNHHDVTPAQILIRFLIQNGFVAIPKSTNAQRIKANREVFGFSLTETEMDALTFLDLGEEGRTFKSFAGMSAHPECPRIE